jgi:hypothetical protein
MPVTGEPGSISYNLQPRGKNGKFVHSGRSFEEGTVKSTAGSSTVYCCTRGFGALIERAAHFVGVGSQADQHGAESTMGEAQNGSQPVAARTTGSAPVKRTRKISAAGKKRTAAAARQRWAKFRAAKKKAAYNFGLGEKMIPPTYKPKKKPMQLVIVRLRQVFET